jgi:hypothetical protein
MAWFRMAALTKSDIVQVEERLADISKSQDDLDLVIGEIRSLTADIVSTLYTNADIAAVAKVAPLLATIPPLLREVAPGIKTLEARFASICLEQHQIQTDVAQLLSLVSGLAAQLRSTV